MTAKGISGDGTVVIGAAGGGHNGVYRWTEQGWVDLGFMPGGDSLHRPEAVNTDGSAIAGFGYAFGYWPFRWTSAGGMQNLGGLWGADRAHAYGISGDGSVVVGWSR